jgi:monoterpene epsilon-lactone hydrolase
VTDHSGIVTEDSGQSRKSVIFNQNRRSRSVGTTGHVQTESAVNLDRNTQDYPLAPEHRFPAAYDAAIRARDWIARSGVGRLALVGDSAGGGLALALQGVPMPNSSLAGICVFSPWTDLALTGKSFADPSTYDPVFKREVLAGLASSYLGGANPRDGRASPLFSLPNDLAPLYIQVGSDELLLDDSQSYAQQAAQKGGEVRLDVFEGMHHVFQRDVGTLETAAVALCLAAQFINEHW